jgi:hypothetical protein
VLIPETGKDGLEWIADVEDAGDLFIADAAIVVFAGLFGMVAFVGFYEALRHAGPLMIIAPVAGVAGLVLVTISHATPIALALELAPDYTAANEATQASLAATFDTFAEFCLLMNYFGDIFVWGVTTPLFAIAVLKTRVVPRWIGWVGMVAALFAGWLGLLSPISSIVENISTIGFFAFFIFWRASASLCSDRALQRRLPTHRQSPRRVAARFRRTSARARLLPHYPVRGEGFAAGAGRARPNPAWCDGTSALPIARRSERRRRLGRVPRGGARPQLSGRSRPEGRDGAGGGSRTANRRRLRGG